MKQNCVRPQPQVAATTAGVGVVSARARSTSTRRRTLLAEGGGMRPTAAGILLAATLPTVALAVDDQHELEAKVRGVYWNDEGTGFPTASVPNPKTISYEQSALGLELNYKSPFWGKVIGFDASAYGVQKLGDSGTPTSQLVEVGNNGQLQDGYAAVGQAFVKLKWGSSALVTAGRQRHDSLLLKTTTNRAVPDTYSGVQAVLNLAPGVKVHGAVYDKYRARTTDRFADFRTEASGRHAIDYIGILGASYVAGPLAVTSEFLNAKSYLSKFALIGAYTVPLTASSLKLSSGVLTSRDAGALFVCGAEREVDCVGSSRISNDGMGIYLDAEWKINNVTLAAAAAKFSGLWIEDNFAVDAERTGTLTQDPGTNPFPTSATIGPDFTNNDETVASVRLAYDWKDYVPGLRTAFKYSRGTGAHSSNLTNAAEGKESYREVDVRYDVAFLKNLSVRYLYLNYDSRIDGGSPSATIKGLLRQDWEQHRFYLEYGYRF